MLTLALSISLLQSPNESTPAPFEPLVVTRHQIMVHGRRLGYTATVGRLPIRDNETGEPHAGIFFVAYALEPRRPDRLVTFAWNGGPGSNAGLIQMRGLGPRRFTDAGGLVDNQETWLDRTDLVFIDPVGTGYSRVTRKEYGAEFYQTRGDAESVAEFIRIYRIRFQRWDAPTYLAGESFGVTRAAGVADVLARRRIPLRGVVLIGLALPLERVPVAVREALRVPSYAAAAWHYQRLGPALQPDFARAVSAATRFALDTLAPAFGRPDRPAGGEREALIRGMVAYIGTAPTAVNDWVVEHIPAALRSRVKALGYQGGHATYLDTEARVRLRADVFGFFEINPL